MSTIHLLTSNGNVYNVVIHIATPVGNNSAGFSWSECIKNSHRNNTSLSVGVGPGQITQTEADQIAAGTLIEASMQWGDDLSLNNTQRLAALDVAASHLSSDVLTQYAADLKYFGLVR